MKTVLTSLVRCRKSTRASLTVSKPKWMRFWEATTRLIVSSRGVNKVSEESKHKNENPYTDILLKNKEMYFEFAQMAFDCVMYDMKLYELMKSNFWEFCKTITKYMKISASKFDSKIFSSGTHYSYSPSDATAVPDVDNNLVERED